MREIFDAVFADVAAGRPAAFTVHHANGGSHHYEPAAWFRDRLPGDRALLDQCAGPTLDVGCGPGRLTGALTSNGLPALGIDISDTAVRHARSRGALALNRDVFEAVPGAGRWQHLLLADGNIGIGGDPRRLLRRCRELLDRDGRLHVEVAPPGTPGWAGTVTVGRAGTAAVGRAEMAAVGWAGTVTVGRAGTAAVGRAEMAAVGRAGTATVGSAGTATVGRGPGAVESTMRWAAVPLDEIAALAAAVAMRVTETRTEAGRWFVTLSSVRG